MAIFRFYKMAAAAILNFQNFIFLTLKRAKLHHRAEFRRNRPNFGRDMAIFFIFQDVGHPPSWIGGCVSDWTTHEGRLVVFITVQNLVGNNVVVSIICKF